MTDETVTMYTERLEQALRVMRSLSEHQRTKHFDLEYFATKTQCGTVACIAGHCGLDPWFQERGFITEVGTGGNIGNMSMAIEDFFGTEAPFFTSKYPAEIRMRGVTYEDAVAALERAIERMRS